MTNGGSSVVEHRQNTPEGGGSIPSPRTLLRRRVGKHFAVKWGERLGWAECPYLRRWAFLFGAFSVRVHHFYRSDDERAPHNHPWWFVTLVLRGGYTDVSPDGEDDHLSAGSVRYRPAHHRHTVRTDPGGCWTMVVTGPILRPWGFFVNGRFKKANKYFLEHGHHPCD